MKTVDILTMTDALSSKSSSINIQNAESDFNCFYHMNVPFQITLEFCSGATSEDYINVVTLSAEKSLLYQETSATKNHSSTKNLMHFHDYFEFVVVLEGEIIQKIEGTDYLYSAGSCCLINRSLCHLEQYHNNAKVLFIGLSPEFICNLFTSAQTSLFINEKEILYSDIFRFISSDLREPGDKEYLDFIPTYQNQQSKEHLHSLAESMVHTLLYPDFGAYHNIKGLICSFLAYLSSRQDYHCTNIKLNTNSDFLLFSRITHLFEESNGRMSRTSLEQYLHYSGDYLNRIVNKYSGMCLYDYSMTFCLSKAAKCLTETNDSVCDIAASLKFTNRTHFYKLFKAKYGVSPKEYRLMHR